MLKWFAVKSITSKKTQLILADYCIKKTWLLKEAEICCACGRERRREGIFVTAHASVSSIIQVLLLLLFTIHLQLSKTVRAALQNTILLWEQEVCIDLAEQRDGPTRGAALGCAVCIVVT